jgi:peptidyl-tRNA hydrolase
MGLNPSQLISVYDDLDRELGKFGIKKGGSAK